MCLHAIQSKADFLVTSFNRTPQLKNIDTPRLILRPLTLDDAPFIIKLVNTPGWLRFIGDKGVANLEGARRYLNEGPLKSYRENNYGLMAIVKKEDQASIGMCGLVRRSYLDHPDIGFAFLPESTGYGYALEAVRAILECCSVDQRFRTILAITSTDNTRSQHLLAKCGFLFVREILNDKSEPVFLYQCELPPANESL